MEEAIKKWNTRAALSAAAEPVKAAQLPPPDIRTDMHIDTMGEPAYSVELVWSMLSASPSPAPAVPDADAVKALEDMTHSRDFYKRRHDLLQQWQSKMRNPERTLVCDILANGQTLPDQDGSRYGLVAVPDAAPSTPMEQYHYLAGKIDGKLEAYDTPDAAKPEMQLKHIHTADVDKANRDALNNAAALLAAGPAPAVPYAAKPEMQGKQEGDK